MKRLLIIIALLRLAVAFAQSNSSFFGKTIDARTLKPLGKVVVTVKNSSLMQITDGNGVFKFTSIPVGDFWIELSSQGYKTELLIVKITSEQEDVDLGTISLEEDLVRYQEDFIITLDNNDLTDEQNGADTSPAFLQSNRDAFQQVAAFSWGALRFSPRGIDSQYSTLMFNGIAMNRQLDGRPLWSNWGGMNDVIKNQETTVGSSPSNYTFGNIQGTSMISTRASTYRPGTKVTFSATNSNYNYRTMITHSSGLSASGWAYTISAANRLAQEGYFNGTSYNANSFFASVEKRFCNKHTVNFTSFYTPNTRAKNSPITDEVFSLTNAKYNSYWGNQGEKQRNARLKIVEEPVFMLNHYFKIKEHSQLNTAVMYQTGIIANTNLDYQNANSPDPVYYRKMPSYYTSLYSPDKGEYEGVHTPDYANAQKSKERFLAQPQIDWDAIFKLNQKPVLNSEGKVTDYEPDKSRIVWYADEVKEKRLIAKSLFNGQLSDNVYIDAGASVTAMKSENYQRLIDLLGGNYFEDIDPYYQGDKSQADLNNPNRKVVVGDKYGYNYDIYDNELNIFTQFQFTYKKVDFYMAQEYSNTNYQRSGNYKNGIYPQLSYGKSKVLRFENFGFKGGLTFKISGKQYITLNGLYKGNAPTIRNSFSNVRLNNVALPTLQSEMITSLDISYNYKTSKFKGRLTGYFNTIDNATRISFFYAEGIFGRDESYFADAFISQTLYNIDKKNLGVEVSLDYQLLSAIRVLSAVALGKYNYSGNPQVYVANDAKATATNPNPLYNFGESKLKNYYQAGTPQVAMSFGLEYRSEKYWWLGSNINYLANSYIDVAPLKRTDNFFINPISGRAFPEANEERARLLLKQEKLAPALFLNLNGGKSWRIKGNYVGLFVSINNLLDSLIKSGGFEQARKSNYRELNHDISSGTPSFGNKYYYAYGRTYFINLAVGF